MDLATLLRPILWQFFKLFLALIAFAIVLGLIVGIFTYGRPLKKRRSDGWLDDIADAGMLISHLLIGSIVRTFKGNRGQTWFNDQELIAMLRGMRPSEFEEYIARTFEALGYRARIVGGAGDGGIDIEMTKDGRQHIVQCKKFITQKVTPHDVRDFFGAMAGRNIDGKGFFVTTNIFTLEAEQFAEGKPIELIDGARLVQLVRKSGIIGSPKQSDNPPAIQQTESCPTCGADLVPRINRGDGSRFLGCSRYPKCQFTKSL